MSDIRDEARQALRALDKAGNEIGEVAADVRGRWRMSIPARPSYDTDLIIADACATGESVIRRLLAELDAMETERDNAIAALERGAS